MATDPFFPSLRYVSSISLSDMTVPNAYPLADSVRYSVLLSKPIVPANPSFISFPFFGFTVRFPENIRSFCSLKSKLMVPLVVELV